MITIQTQTFKKPSIIQPAYSVNGVSVQSDKTTEPSHRFLFDVYVDGTKVGRLKSLASYSNYSSVEVSDLVKNYVENEFIHQHPRSVLRDEEHINTTTKLYAVIRTARAELIKVRILVGEEYKVNGVLTIFDGQDVQGEPNTEVAEWFSTYQAMDANSPQILIGRGGITNSQFQANHFDVLEYIHRVNHNTFEWREGVPRNVYVYVDDSNYTTIWKNNNVKELSNRPLDRDINVGTPASISYFEGEHFTTFTSQDDLNAAFDIKLSTLGRAYYESPFEDYPLNIGNYNTYKQRIHTIGYDFYDPAGLSVGEYRYQPESPVFNLPIRDTFSFDYYPQSGEEGENGVKFSDFLQVNIQSTPEATKYDRNKSTDIINLSSDIDYGDLRGFSSPGGLDYFFNSDQPLTLNTRSDVRYTEGEKMCSYTPPSYISYDYNTDPYEQIVSGSSDGPYVLIYSDNGFEGQIPYTQNITLSSLDETKVNWDFYTIQDRIEIIEDGSVIYDSGYTAGAGSYTWTPSNVNITIKIYRDNSGTLWEYQAYQKLPEDTHIVSLTPNRFYKLDFDVVDTLVKIIENGNEIYNSGAMTGVGTSGRLYITSNEITIQFFRQTPNWDFSWVLYGNDIQDTSLILEDTAIPDLQPLKNRWTSGGNTYQQQTSTFTTFVNVEHINNIGYDKNLINNNDLSLIRSGEHFYIQGEYIIGIDNTKGELYGDRYKFNAAPCLKVWNNTENRWCNQAELESLTMRSLEGINYYGVNGRPVIEVLNATTYGQDEQDEFKEIGMTFKINRTNYGQIPDIIAYPGVFNGFDFLNMASNINIKVDRFRLVRGTDKPLRNANNYKINLYDYDHNYNLIREDWGNGGKFLYNKNNWNSTQYSQFYELSTNSTFIPYWTFGVNGNDFGYEGEKPYGLLNTWEEQYNLAGRIINLPAGANSHRIVQTNPQTYRIGPDTLAMSHIMRYDESDGLSGGSIINKYIEKYGTKIYIEVSCMVLVTDSSGRFSPTLGDSHLHLGPVIIGPGLTLQQEYYNATDIGRWKRISFIQGINAADFVENPQYNYSSQVELNVQLFGGNDESVWNGKYFYMSDFRVNYLLEDELGQSGRDNATHKVYTKSLKKFNEGNEPHYTFSGDKLRNEAYSLYWLNPYGAWDDYRFKGRSIKTLSADKQTRGVGLSETGTLNSDAVRNKQNFGNNITYKVEAYETYELTSDFLNDEEREWMEECFISPKHFIYDENTKWFIRVDVLDKEYTTIKKNNQKLYQIKLKVQVSSERRTQQVLGSI